METGIIIAIISAVASIVVGLLTFAGVVITNRRANAEMLQKMAVQQAITDTKLEELTREVREHNNFAKRVPEAESEIRHIVDEVNRLRSYHER